MVERGTVNAEVAGSTPALAAPIAGEQVRQIFALLEKGVKFTHHGGVYCVSSAGQRFHVKHLYMARAIRKLKSYAKKKLKEEKDQLPLAEEL